MASADIATPCIQCGSVTRPGATFCDHCGIPLGVAGVDSYLDSGEKGPPPPAVPQTRSRWPLTALLLSAAAIVFAGLVGAFVVAPLVAGDTSDPADWTDVHSDSGRFAARFPVAPRAEVLAVQTMVGERRLHVLRCTQGKAQFEVSWFDLRGADGREAAYSPERGLDLMAEQGRLVSRDWVEVGDVLALRADIHVGEHDRNEVAILVRQGRVYVIALSGVRRDQPSQFGVFLNSLKFD